MIRIPKRAISTLATGLALGVVLTSCGSGDQHKGEADGGASAQDRPHGYVAGAEETAEQQSRLVVQAEDGRTVHLLDLIEGEKSALGRARGSAELAGDGRFAFARSAHGVEVFDSGAWMVDHGDHVHYYRAKPRRVGAVRGQKPRYIHSSSSITALTYADGTAKLLDHAAMEKGRLRTTAQLDEVESGPVVPLKESVLVPVVDAEGRTVLEVRDARGRKQSRIDEECAEPRGAAVTRNGVVLGCADGALFVKEGSEGKPSAESIPFDEDVSDNERPRDFRHRSLGSTLTAKAGERGVWLLDVAKRRWRLVETGPVVASNTAGFGAPLLTLDTSGTLRAFDASSGKETKSRKLLDEQPRKGVEPVIEIDANRAYVNDPAGRKVHEIDYNDGLRKARSFSLDFAPTEMVETGR